MTTEPRLVRVAAVGDVHCTKTSQGELQPLFQQINDNADILVLCGDLTELTDPRWLAKAYSGEDFIDVIFSSGNAIAEVDDTWFEHAIEAKVLGLSVQLCPPADIAHLLRAYGDRLDWERLLERFASHWRVLLSHLILFGFIYPFERGRIPPSVMDGLLDRLQSEIHHPSPAGRLCQGTLLSRVQYAIDIDRWGYQDARLLPLDMSSPPQAMTRHRRPPSRSLLGPIERIAPGVPENDDLIQEFELFR